MNTCICYVFASNVEKESVELHEKLGCEVDCLTNQTCCSQPAFNRGYLEATKKTKKQMMNAYVLSIYVICTSGGCAGMVKEYPKIFKGDPVWEPRAKKLANKTYEITQFIVNVLGIEDVGATFNKRVTYHPSCHMTRILGVKEEPM